jgi:tetratricopeptide (TPR) repeat protein
MSKKSGRRSAMISGHRHVALSRLANLAKNGDYATLLAEAKAAYQRNPADAATVKALAAAHLGLGNNNEAKDLLLSLVKRVPADWELWLNLGAAENKLGNLEAAIAAYERGLELNASDAESCAALAMLLRVANDHGKALNWFYSALEADPENTGYFLEWVSTLDRLRYFEQALDCLRAAWEDEPEDPRIAGLMARIALGLGDWELHEAAEAILSKERSAGRMENMPHLYLVALEGYDWRTQRELLVSVLRSLDLSLFKSKLPLCASGLAPMLGMRNKRLRIGYLSADMYTHATAILIAGVFEQHAEVGLDLYV